MVQAVRDGTTTSYAYNGLGQRVLKSNAAGPRYFVYGDSGHLIGVYGAGGSLVEELVWLGDIPIATVRHTESPGVGVFYIHTDHLNTPTKLTRDVDNAIMWRWDRDPYGNGAPNEDAEGNGQYVFFNLRFPGQYLDEETGLHYNYFRDYDPATGGYAESDPIGLSGGSLSTYSYVGGNPVGATDSSGLAGTAGAQPMPSDPPGVPRVRPPAFPPRMPPASPPLPGAAPNVGVLGRCLGLIGGLLTPSSISPCQDMYPTDSSCPNYKGVCGANDENCQPNRDDLCKQLYAILMAAKAEIDADRGLFAMMRVPSAQLRQSLLQEMREFNVRAADYNRMCPPPKIQLYLFGPTGVVP